jgi:hypothetical protein
MRRLYKVKKILTISVLFASICTVHVGASYGKSAEYAPPIPVRMVKVAEYVPPIPPVSYVS